MEPDARHLRLVPQDPDVDLIRTALRELHDLAASPDDPASVVPASPQWHPSMGARLTAVR
jgi:hypothetical protein